MIRNKNLSAAHIANVCTKIAFTLAEVLITLAVIGVVAAMTLPVLIQKQQKMVWVNQLKKSVSLLEQGFQTMLADDEVENIVDTEVWKSMTSNCTSTTTCSAFYDNLKKYFKITSVSSIPNYGYRPLNFDYLDIQNVSSNTIQLSDGIIIFDYTFNKTPEVQDVETCNEIKSLGGNMCGEAGSFAIDVNGTKGPNRYGRDMFSFSISDKGKLYPLYGKDQALNYNQTSLNDNNEDYWRNAIWSCGTPEENEIPEDTEGTGCAARIMENNWVMDY